MSNWFRIDRCIKCKTEIGENKYYNSGICPHCGHRGSDSVTIVKTEIGVRRMISPWWRLWNTEYETRWEEVV